MSSIEILDKAKRLRALAHLGLTYATNEYEIERYQELQQISLELMNLSAGFPSQILPMYFSQVKEYITPKVDVRAVIFNDQQEILLVKEKADGRWSLPGGWADIGFSPTEIAVKEAREETGYDVEAVRLLAVLDKRCHPHPPQPDYVYKIFIRCKILSGAYKQAFDILDVSFFGKESLPELSTDRVLPEQIDLMFAFLDNPDKEAVID